jgi:beta-mannosidase
MPIPGHWHLAGLDFLGKVWFRKRFVPEQAEGSRLCFKGVDYMARVWFNGNYLGSHTGYFDPFYFDVSDNMEPGRENIVAAPRGMERAGPGYDHRGNMGTCVS